MMYEVDGKVGQRAQSFAGRRLWLLVLLAIPVVCSARGRMRDYGIVTGVLKCGEHNAITDVNGVKVGHVTLVERTDVRTGVTAILPHGGNIFQAKVPAAIFIGNGFGKLTGYSQVEELGNIETPIILTNTLSVPTAGDALIDHMLSYPENKDVRSVNPVVGETNDGRLNDIQGRHVRKSHVLGAIARATAGPVAEGNVGAGTGTQCHGFKGGIGTASRVLPAELGGWTVGVLVQTNFGGILQIDGVPVGVELGRYYYSDVLERSPDGSCMIVVLTDAPLDARNLKRVAKRAMLGLARTGGVCSNSSGDYVIAVSTAKEVRVPYRSDSFFNDARVLRNNKMTPIFMATVEATEEAILNSLFKAESMTGRDGNTTKALPLDETLAIMKKYNRIQP